VCLCRSNVCVVKVMSLYSENKTTALRNTFTSISEANWAKTQLEKNWHCYKRYQRQFSKIRNILWKNKLKPRQLWQYSTQMTITDSPIECAELNSLLQTANEITRALLIRWHLHARDCQLQICHITQPNQWLVFLSVCLLG